MEIKLDKEYIEELLSELGDRMQRDGVYSVMYIYGGTVMCAAYELRGTTFDVDCIYDNSIVERYAKNIARDYNIQDSWLNSAIRDIVYEDMIKEEVYDEIQYGNLKVVIPSMRQMLAMKLFSARMGTSEDFDDAWKLSQELGIKTEGQLRNILSEFFRQDSIRDRNKRHSNIIGKFIRNLSEEL